MSTYKNRGNLLASLLILPRFLKYNMVRCLRQFHSNCSTTFGLWFACASIIMPAWQSMFICVKSIISRACRRWHPRFRVGDVFAGNRHALVCMIETVFVCAQVGNSFIENKHFQTQVPSNFGFAIKVLHAVHPLEYQLLRRGNLRCALQIHHFLQEIFRCQHKLLSKCRQ